MRRASVLIGFGIAALALTLSLVVVLPVFAVVNRLYDGGHGLTRLLIGTVLAWLLIAWLLRRCRVAL